MKNVKRCDWAGSDPLYCAYHDDEWGVPVHDDRLLFEFLVLEGFQAGLSWITILRKRAAFRRAFDRFDWEKVARFDGQLPVLLRLLTVLIAHREPPFAQPRRACGAAIRAEVWCAEERLGEAGGHQSVAPLTHPGAGGRRNRLRAMPRARQPSPEWCAPRA